MTNKNIIYTVLYFLRQKKNETLQPAYHFPRERFLQLDILFLRQGLYVRTHTHKKLSFRMNKTFGSFPTRQNKNKNERIWF